MSQRRFAAPHMRWWTASPTTLPRCPRGRSGSRSPGRCANSCSSCPCRRIRQRWTTWSQPRCAMSCRMPWATATRPSSAGSTRRRPPAAAAMNPSVVSGDHADVHLERAVVRWLAELVGFPHAPGAGLLTSGGSAATIVCLAGARSRALATAGHDVRRDGLAGAPQLIAYVPAEAHSCVRRALELLGLGSCAMREVPLEAGRLDATALRASVAADRASGALPALLVGSAGTVNTGAIDPL